MSRTTFRLASAAAALAIAATLSAPARLHAWEAAEHRALAERALAATLADTGVTRALAAASADAPGALAAFRDGAPLWRGLGFGALSAWSARDDRDRDRYQERGRTVLEQIGGIAPADIERAWRAWGARGPADSARHWTAPAHPAAAGRNAIANYVLDHVAALRLARRGGESGRSDRDGGIEDLRRALIVEAFALGFLADAFSSAHLLVPVHDPLSRLHPVNTRRLHERYASVGVYVIDARGEAWQAFGDRLLDWYPASRSHVEEACATSVRELIAAFLVAAGNAPLPPPLTAALGCADGDECAARVAAWSGSRPGPDYLVELRCPTLMRIPTPVSATWSVTATEHPDDKSRRRLHAPQVREAGGHDPDLAPRDVRRLATRAAWPPWMTPDSLTRADAAALIRSNPAVASVRFVQARDPGPGYAGNLIQLGCLAPAGGQGDGPAPLLAIARAWTDEGPPRRLSADLALVLPAGRDSWRALSATLGWTPRFPPFPGATGMVARAFELVRVDVGLAWGLGRADRGQGSRVAVGIETPTLPFGFTNAGVALRAQFNWFQLAQTRRGLSLNLVLH